MPPVARSIVLRLPLRPRPASALLRQWQQRAFASSDSKLHPNPNVVPSTDPQASRPGADASGTGKAANKGPNMDQLPHVSEEAAAMSKTMGSDGPDVDQGTPVSEVVKDDKDAKQNLPKVMRDAMDKQKNNPSGSRPFSTSTRLRADLESTSQDAASDEAMPPPSSDIVGNSTFTPPARKFQEHPGQFHEINEEEATLIALGRLKHPDQVQAEADRLARLREGLKFGEPSTPREKQRHLRRRYMGVLDQVINMIMKHGLKAKAQKQMSDILLHLRTSPAPTLSKRRLAALPAGVGTHAQLPLHPVQYLTMALDSVSPLLRLRSMRGLAGGGVVLQIPTPLTVRQRRRTAIVWILEAVEKRKGSTSDFPKRFAEEITAIVEGRSSVWGRRENVHRMGIAGRSNLGVMMARRK